MEIYLIATHGFGEKEECLKQRIFPVVGLEQ